MFPKNLVFMYRIGLEALFNLKMKKTHKMLIISILLFNLNSEIRIGLI